MLIQVSQELDCIEEIKSIDRYPSFDLLKKYDFDGTTYIDLEEQQANKNKIVDVLWNFGVVVSTIKATVGPRVTLYEISLAPGVNASKLRGLEDDIALALSSHNVHFTLLLFLWKVF